MTTPKEEGLKPCEHCGKQPVRFGLADAYRCEPCMKNSGWMSKKDWNRRAQSPPVAQVEVYRKALEEILGSCDGDLCADMNHHEIAREALLTSKPEPVAPVRKWEAEEEK